MEDNKMRHKGGKRRLLILTILLLIVSIICFYESAKLNKHDDTEEENKSKTTTAKEVKVEQKEVTEVQCMSTIQKLNIEPVKESIDDCLELSSNEQYLLAKIAMAEAEGEDYATKLFVIATVLNRVESNDFPDTVEEVIYQHNGETYQFSPVGDGRFDRVEPNDECWKAVNAIISGTNQGRDMSYYGILYFESSDKVSNWHSRNLEFVFKRGNMKFYK